MYTSLSLFRAGALVGLLGLTVAGSAHAAANAQASTILGPGARGCVSVYATNSVLFSGTASARARFIISTGPNFNNLTVFRKSTPGALSFNTRLDRFFPEEASLFPGVFQLCGRNLSQSNQALFVSMEADPGRVSPLENLEEP